MNNKEFIRFIEIMGVGSQDCDYLKKPFIYSEGIVDLRGRIVDYPHKRKYIKLKDKFNSLWQDNFWRILREGRERSLRLIVRNSCYCKENVTRYEDILKRYGCYNYVSAISGSPPVVYEVFEEVVEGVIDTTMGYFDKYDVVYALDMRLID